MLSIAALTPGINSPSARFRIRQNISGLLQEGITVTEYASIIKNEKKLGGVLGKIRQRYVFPISGALELAKLSTRYFDIIKANNSDAVWVNRYAYYLKRIEFLIKKPLFFDVDDAIWIGNEARNKKLAQQAMAVIAGNSYIAEWYKKYQENVYIVNTGIDILKFTLKSTKNNEQFIIGWTGTSDNLKYLYSIEKGLNKALNHIKNSRLLIVCDKEPLFSIIPIEKMVWKKWNMQDEIELLHQMDVGIMPLEDTEWAKGKCSFKMLQYMAVGIPVVVSPVGMNKEVLLKGDCGFAAINETEWADALISISENMSLKNALGSKGREIIENYFSTKVISGQLAEIFKKLLH
jgi:glycosyltransferase involved in cell wall biosynthesis